MLKDRISSTCLHLHSICESGMRTPFTNEDDKDLVQHVKAYAVKGRCVSWSAVADKIPRTDHSADTLRLPLQSLKRTYGMAYPVFLPRSSPPCTIDEVDHLIVDSDSVYQCTTHEDKDDHAKLVAAAIHAFVDPPELQQCSEGAETVHPPLLEAQAATKIVQTKLPRTRALTCKPK
ncbi:hypothetical protein GQ600_7359 [Phytophthora cactorum]|nr:hypothetical protein GQ600_7359 [Phytophthora cactorum]